MQLQTKTKLIYLKEKIYRFWGTLYAVILAVVVMAIWTSPNCGLYIGIFIEE